MYLQHYILLPCEITQTGKPQALTFLREFWEHTRGFASQASYEPQKLAQPQTQRPKAEVKALQPISNSEILKHSQTLVHETSHTMQ